MPIQLKINIVGGSGAASFDPSNLAASPRDQIFWSNSTSEAHWPGLVDDQSPLDADQKKKYFMPNQIAPNGDVSQTFSPTVAATFKYKCSVHPDRNEVGTVTVS